MTPATVHHGIAEQTHAARREVLDAAYAAGPRASCATHPDRQRSPPGAWINKPDRQEVAN